MCLVKAVENSLKTHFVTNLNVPFSDMSLILCNRTQILHKLYRVDACIVVTTVKSPNIKY